MKEKGKSSRVAAATALTFSLLVTSGMAAEELTELDDLVVTGTRTEKKLSEVPVRTELIKRETIECTAARSLADVCDFTPGVRVENKCLNCNFTEIRLLGMDGPYSQVLIDGQPVMSAMAAVYGIEHIPSRQIDRVELIKGGGSALYGPGAVAGVVNVISRNPTESGGDIDVTIEDIDGSTSTSFSGAADVLSSDGKSRLSVYGQADSRDGYDRNGDGFIEINERDLTSIGLNLRQYIGENADLSIDYTHTDETRRGGNKLDLPPFLTELTEAVETTRDAATLTWSQSLNDEFDYRLTTAVTLTERDTYYGGLEAAGGNTNDAMRAYGSSKNPMALFDSQFNHYFGDHTLTWGAQYSWEELEDSQPGHELETKLTYSNVGLYLQDDWKVADPLSIVIGGRIDAHSEMNDAVFSPRLALKWAPTDDLTVRGSYARGFRPAQIFSEDLHIETVGGDAQVIENADDLEEEKSDSFTLGGEWTPAIGQGFGLFEVTGFYTMLQDKFNFRKNGTTPSGAEINERYNASDATIYGAEFNIGYQKVDQYEVRLGWVFQNSEFDNPEEIVEGINSTEFGFTPKSYGIFRATYNAPADTRLFLGAKYTGSMDVPHDFGDTTVRPNEVTKTDAFVSWDASIAKTFPFDQNDLTLTLGVKNIFDEYQDDIDEGAGRDPAYIYGPRLPRTLYASVKYQF